MRVVLSDVAKRDLHAIAAWIAADNPTRARSFWAELRATCLSLSERPSRFPVVLETSQGDVHKRVHQSYLIFYRIGADEVEIARIVYGSRDWARLL